VLRALVKSQDQGNLSNPFGGEQKTGSKGFILEVETKVCQNGFGLMWHHFGVEFSWS
jgi:hypothetical protein